MEVKAILMQSKTWVVAEVESALSLNVASKIDFGRSVV